MTIERLNELLRVTGHLIPEGMEEHIADLESGETELLPRETLVSVLEANGVTGESGRSCWTRWTRRTRCPS